MSSYEQKLQQTLSDPFRIKALQRTQLLDSEPEVAFDRLTKLATRLTKAPVSLVSLVDEERQFFKSTFGLPDELAGIRETPLSHSFCQHALLSEGPLVANDTRLHEHAQAVQAVEDFGIHSYLGIPLETPAKETLGTLCVFGFMPRKWSEPEIQTMHDLAAIAMTEIALRLELRTQLELQDAIKESEMRYKSVIEGIHDVVFKLDEAGRIAFVNPAWESILGFDVGATLGNSIGDFLPRDDTYGHPMEALNAYADTQKAYTTHLRTQQGEMKWLEVRVKHHHEEKGLVGVISDVTDSYRVEAEREARKQAERHLKLKDALLSNMSHEIRTPITAIMSCSEILREEVESEHKDFAEMICEGGERLLATLDTMLLYAQVESNNAKPELSDLDVVQEVHQVVDLCNSKTLRVSIDAPQRLEVRSDRSFLEVMLRCVIDNAVKFTAKGEVVVRVSDTAHDFSIAVVDTGIGIPASYQPNLFTPFEQASTGNARAFEGCGLGLPLTKLLTDLLKGTIAVQSEEGKGTTVTIKLPKNLS